MNKDRAVQFAPFASLRGYYDMTHSRERLAEPRRKLSDEEEMKINAVLSNIKKGDMLRVRYYKADGYETKVGVCSRLDLSLRRLTVLNEQIPIDDIIFIEKEN